MKQSSGIGAAQGVQPRLFDAVNSVFTDSQRIIEKDLFGFALADLMLFDALDGIAIIYDEGKG